MDITLADLSALVLGDIVSGLPTQTITGFASLQEARDGDLSFFHDVRYQDRLLKTKASAVLVPVGCSAMPSAVACIAVGDPSKAFEQVVEKYGFQPLPYMAGIHPTAVIASTAVYDPGRVSIGAHAVVEDGAVIGHEVTIGAGCFVGCRAKIGNGTKLFAGSTVHDQCILGERVILHSGVVIGADGFGYEFDKGRHRKVRQAGIVQIDNDVEIGAGSTVDRARFGRTWIGEGTKIDNLVQIGHNVIVGKHCIIVACTAIAGSAQIGDYVVIAAQSGIAGHVEVGSQSQLGARSGVTKSLGGGQTYFGFPAVPAAQEKRRLASVNRLPQLMARVKELEQMMAKMSASSD